MSTRWELSVLSALMVNFCEITPENWRKFKLEVRDHQKRHVSSYTATLARAYVYRNFNSIVFAICEGKNAIGLLMQRDYIDDKGQLICVLDQFFIDHNYQGRGYGKDAMKLWLTNVARTNKYIRVDLCFIAGNHTAEKFYESLGFIRNRANDDGDELTMTYQLY